MGEAMCKAVAGKATAAQISKPEFCPSYDHNSEFRLATTLNSIHNFCVYQKSSSSPHPTCWCQLLSSLEPNRPTNVSRPTVHYKDPTQCRHSQLELFLIFLDLLPCELSEFCVHTDGSFHVTRLRQTVCQCTRHASCASSGRVVWSVMS